MQTAELGDPLQRSTAQSPVLVLNQNYEPLNVCNVHRAMRLVFGSKAEVLETYGQPVRTTTRNYDAPAVIRLIYMIRRPRPRVKLTRREIFARDEHACQYCGTRSGDMTIDHIIPRSRGGVHSWDNLVTACRPCNHRKGGKTLTEARMRLRHEPYEPRPGAYYTIQRRVPASTKEMWSRFVPGLDEITQATLPSSASD